MPWFEYETCCLRSIAGYLKQIDQLDQDGKTSLMSDPKKVRSWLMTCAGEMLGGMEEARSKSHRTRRPRRFVHALLIEMVYDRMMRGKRAIQGGRR